jgi:hypothetical protein
MWKVTSWRRAGRGGGGGKRMRKRVVGREGKEDLDPEVDDGHVESLFLNAPEPFNDSVHSLAAAVVLLQHEVHHSQGRFMAPGVEPILLHEKKEFLI